MLSSTSRSRRSTARSTLAVALGLILAIPAVAPLAPAVAAGDGGARALLAEFAAAAGLTWAEVEAGPWTLVTFDGTTGATTTEELGLSAALDAVADSPAGGDAVAHEPGQRSHNVSGGLRHTCSDGTRLCYVWEVLASAQAERDAAAASYEATVAGSGVPPAAEDFPLPAGQAVHLWGKYYKGTHRANNTAPLFERDLARFEGVSVEERDFGTGVLHYDRSLRGVGVAHISLIYFGWGPGLFVSFGKMSAQGSFTLCEREETPECQSDALDLVPPPPTA